LAFLIRSTVCLLTPVPLALVVPHHIEGVDPLFAQGGIILDVFAHLRDYDGKLVVLVPQLLYAPVALELRRSHLGEASENT
jgi:hypothetical protein